MNSIYTQGAVVALIGVCTVFVVLAIVWGVLELMHVVFAKKQNQTAAPAPAVSVSTSAAPTPAEDDGELVAVLMAAIAASLNQTTTYNLRIKSYRRIDAGTPVWNKTARRDNVVG